MVVTALGGGSAVLMMMPVANITAAAPATTTATTGSIAAANRTTTTAAAEPTSTTTGQPDISETSTTTEAPTTTTTPKPKISVTTTNPRNAAASDPLIAKAVALTNSAREEAGCDPLTVDSRITRAAELHSTDMSVNSYFSHTSQDGRTFADRLTAAGYPKPGGENIAQGARTAEQVVDMWMNSQGHRENILNCGFKAIGMGVAKSGWYWTQDFGW
jgi:uncharacterized protein YkwD